MIGDRSGVLSGDRLHALDVFRGITIAAMVLVNNPGSWSNIYPPLRHAEWHGWTPTDLVFPFFMWIVGVSTALSHEKFVARGGSSRGFAAKSARRAAIVFGLGLFLAAFPFGTFGGHRFDLATLRIPGVLQRIAVCQFLAVLIHIATGVRGKVVAILCLLIGSSLLMKFVPVPGYGAGDWSPDGNLARYVDSIVLAGHTWKSAIRPGFDPEGIVSTIPAVATVVFGILAGQWLRAPRTDSEKAIGLAVLGSATAALGRLLDPWLPINKPLWTSTYCLFTAGLAASAVAALFFVVDMRSRRRWALPFTIFGTNAIAAYVLSGLLARTLGLQKTTSAEGKIVSVQSRIFTTYFLPIGDARLASFLYAVAFSFVVFLPIFCLWRKRWFLKV